MAHITNMQEAIATLEDVLTYLKIKESRESGRPESDLSHWGAYKVKDAPADKD